MVGKAGVGKTQEEMVLPLSGAPALAPETTGGEATFAHFFVICLCLTPAFECQY